MQVNNLMMQAERLHTRDLKSEQSAKRTEALTFRCDEWSVDLSKQYLDEVVLEALSEWVSERGWLRPYRRCLKVSR